jgi:Uma2 family endonuclease
MKIASIPANSDEATDSQSREPAYQFESGDISGLKKKDPYPYGWREIPRLLPDGKEIHERVPLTLEDILHPEVGDFRMHSREHQRFCRYLCDVLENRVADDPTAAVLDDVLVAWAHPGIRGHGPDIAVIFNVQQQQNWSTFDEVEEGTKPSLIIEITSPSTYSVDLETKVDHYAQVGVEWYVIVDIVIRRDMPSKRLLGYQLTPDGYELLEPNAEGWLWLAPVNLWLGWHGEDIACYDADGNLIGDYNAVVDARIQAEERAAQEAQARTAAEKRADDADQARATAEKRADDADQARHQLEAELRRLRGEADTE